MNRKISPFAAVAALAVVATAAPLDRSEAGRALGYDYVIAHSDFGNGSVQGAIRRTRLGRQVQLPGGTWVYCRQLCSETLRVQTVDFWEFQRGGRGNRRGTSDVHLFGKLKFGWPRY
ncbi:MAG: hypothetical protein AAFO62_03475 [Pseudomonadota bacterium]